MAVERGILLEINGRHAVVLTPQGSFERVPAEPGWQVGHEVRIARRSGRSKWFGASWRSWQRVAAVAATVALLVTTVGLGDLLKPAPVLAAYVTIDINPSLELGVDAKEQVVQARGLNAEGETLLREIKVKGLNLEAAVTALTEAALEDGLIQPEDPTSQVLIAAAPAQEGPLPAPLAASVRERAVQAAVQAIARAGANPSPVAQAASHVHAMVADQATKEAADQAGISIGKLRLAQMAEEMGQKIELSELKKESLGELIRSGKLDANKLFKELQQQSESNAGPGKGRKPGEAGDDKGQGNSDKGDNKAEPAKGNSGGSAVSPGKPAGDDTPAGPKPGVKQDDKRPSQGKDSKEKADPPGRAKKASFSIPLNLASFKDWLRSFQ